jgi:hypothetical protein
MKKHLLVLTLTLSTISNASAIPYSWFKEIFGCVWHVCNKQTDPIPGTLNCVISWQYCGSSWLWGNCPARGGDFHVAPCPSYGYQVDSIIAANCPNCMDMQWRMALKASILDIEALGQIVPSGWKDTSNYDDSITLKAIVVWRLRLAGYDASTSWLNNAGAGIPVSPTLPPITLEVIVPQASDWDDGNMTVGINSNEYSEVLELYPNPFTNSSSLTIQLTHSQISNIEIFNATGMLVYSNAAPGSNKVIINSENWSKGVYFVKIANSNGIRYHKTFVKE